jgi:hypothetical protein
MCFYLPVFTKEYSVSSYWTLYNDGHRNHIILFSGLNGNYTIIEYGNLTASVENFQNLFYTSLYFMDFPDSPTSLPDFFMAAFGRHCFPQTFRIVGKLPGSVATTLPGF